MATKKQINYILALDSRAKAHGYFVDETPNIKKIESLTVEQASETIQALKNLLFWDNTKRMLLGRKQVYAH